MSTVNTLCCTKQFSQWFSYLLVNRPVVVPQTVRRGGRAAFDRLVVKRSNCNGGGGGGIDPRTLLEGPYGRDPIIGAPRHGNAPAFGRQSAVVCYRHGLLYENNKTRRPAKEPFSTVVCYSFVLRLNDSVVIFRDKREQ